MAVGLVNIAVLQQYQPQPSSSKMPNHNDCAQMPATSLGQWDALVGIKQPLARQHPTAAESNAALLLKFDEQKKQLQHQQVQGNKKKHRLYQDIQMSVQQTDVDPGTDAAGDVDDDNSNPLLYFNDDDDGDSYYDDDGNDDNGSDYGDRTGDDYVRNMFFDGEDTNNEDGGDYSSYRGGAVQILDINQVMVDDLHVARKQKSQPPQQQSRRPTSVTPTTAQPSGLGSRPPSASSSFRARNHQSGSQNSNQSDYVNTTNNISGSAATLQRPKSANAAVRRHSYSTAQPSSNVSRQPANRNDSINSSSVKRKNKVDTSSLFVTGAGVSSPMIRFIDTCCFALEQTDLLQRYIYLLNVCRATVYSQYALCRWARRVIARTRLYHATRRSASIRMQCAVRIFLARSRRFHLLRYNMSVRIQSSVRRHQAIRLKLRLRANRAATIMQKCVRGLLAKRYLCLLRKQEAARKVWRFWCVRVEMWQRKAAFKVVW
jgi:hypothetical protein